MDTPFATPVPMTLDLTGLPAPVIEKVKNIVAEARVKQIGETGESLPVPQFVSRPRPSREESRRLLDEMAAMSSGQSLPLDFSRADIYDDHD
jgi:hypothetical protein